jgi:hypothetical protein
MILSVAFSALPLSGAFSCGTSELGGSALVVVPCVIAELVSLACSSAAGGFGAFSIPLIGSPGRANAAGTIGARNSDAVIASTRAPTVIVVVFVSLIFVIHYLCYAHSLSIIKIGFFTIYTMKFIIVINRDQH